MKSLKEIETTVLAKLNLTPVQLRLKLRSRPEYYEARKEFTRVASDEGYTMIHISEFLGYKYKMSRATMLAEPIEAQVKNWYAHRGGRYEKADEHRPNDDGHFKVAFG